MHRRRRALLAMLPATLLAGGWSAARAEPPASPPPLALPGGLQAVVQPGLPRELLILPAEGGPPRRRWPLADAQGRAAQGAVQWLHWPARQSLVVAPGDLPELWELNLDPQAEDRYDGLVHDFRFGEGVPVPGFLHRRRITLAGPVHAWAADATGTLLVIVIARPTAGGAPLLQAWNLDARRIARRWPWPAGAEPGGAPVIDPAAGVLWLPDARTTRPHRLELTEDR